MYEIEKTVTIQNNVISHKFVFFASIMLKNALWLSFSLKRSKYLKRKSFNTKKRRKIHLVLKLTNIVHLRVSFQADWKYFLYVSKHIQDFWLSWYHHHQVCVTNCVVSDRFVLNLSNAGTNKIMVINFFSKIMFQMSGTFKLNK